jgi:hypothetical protein
VQQQESLTSAPLRQSSHKLPSRRIAKREEFLVRNEMQHPADMSTQVLHTGPCDERGIQTMPEAAGMHIWRPDRQPSEGLPRRKSRRAANARQKEGAKEGPVQAIKRQLGLTE